MNKSFTLFAVIPAIFAFSSFAHADDAKPAPAANVAKSDAAAPNTTAQNNDEHGDCKDKNCKHCKMHHHAKKKNAVPEKSAS